MKYNMLRKISQGVDRARAIVRAEAVPSAPSLHFLEIQRRLETAFPRVGGPINPLSDAPLRGTTSPKWHRSVNKPRILAIYKRATQ